MSRAIQPDYETKYLFPPSLEDWVGPEEPARFIREFVRALDLKALVEEDAAARDSVGRPHYSFEMLLSVWLYAYVYGLKGSREVERACRTLIPMVWLAGRHVPDHNTLWRFWNRYRSKLHEVFVQSVRVALRSGAVGMVLQAVDGTKVLSRGSKRGEWHREDLQKVLAAAETRLDRLEAEIAAAGAGAEGEQDDRLPEPLQQQRALVDRIRHSLAELDAEGQDHLQPNDREARMMVMSNGRTAFAYNAQAVVDGSNGIIVAEDVTDEANDQRQLLPMLDQVESNTGATAETTLADSGYNTAEGLGGAAERNATVLVASKDPRDAGPYHKVRFRYDPDRDQVQCPRGEWLDREGVAKHKDKPYPVTRYRCHVTTCPVRSQCSRVRNGRVIEINPHHASVMRNREALAEPAARKLMRQRSAIVERLFAEVKEVLRFRRWTVTGKLKVAGQWSMMCTAINLRRLIASRLAFA